MDDLEEVYVENIEKEGEIFLDGLQNKKSLGDLEKEYSKKVKEIRRIYEKSLRKDLNEEKEREIKKAKNKIKPSTKDGKEFHVKNLELEETWVEKKGIEINSFAYRTKRRIKNFIQLMIPNYFIYTKYKIIRVLNDFSKEVKNIFENTWRNISENILNVLSFIKEGFIKIVSDISKIPNLFKIFKGKDKTGEKKEDAGKKSEKQTK